MLRWFTFSKFLTPWSPRYRCLRRRGCGWYSPGRPAISWSSQKPLSKLHMSWNTQSRMQRHKNQRNKTTFTLSYSFFFFLPLLCGELRSVDGGVLPSVDITESLPSSSEVVSMKPSWIFWKLTGFQWVDFMRFVMQPKMSVSTVK